MKKVLVILAVIVLMVAGVGGVFFFLNRNDTTEITEPPVTDEEKARQSGDTQINDFVTASIDEIRNKYPNDPAAQYAELLSSGLRKKDFQKYDEAISYLEAAEIVATTDENRVEAQMLIYYIAKDTGNGAVEQKYKNILGDKINEPQVQGMSQET